MNHSHFSLDELARRASVTKRTVRYYIQQGLLPPAEGSGRGATYSQTHLDLLELIGELKERHLPLAEIRRVILEAEAASALPAGPPAPSSAELRRTVFEEIDADGADDAGDYARKILAKSQRKRSKASPKRLGHAPPAPRTSTTAAVVRSRQSTWERHVLASDVELHLQTPLSPSARARVQKLMDFARSLFPEEHHD